VSEPATTARVDAQGGRAALSGEVGFGSAAALWKETSRLLAAAEDNALEVDLAKVESADSAGLALLVGWLAAAKHQGVALRYVNVPDRIRGLAGISEVEPLFAA